MFNLQNPPWVFAAISLLMIVLMVVCTGLIQTPFFRKTIIEREAAIVRDIVYAATVDQGISSADMRNYREAGPASLLERSFRSLLKLPGTTRIKVFNRDGIIVWSDDAGLVGSNQTGHRAELARAQAGDAQALFNATGKNFGASSQARPTDGCWRRPSFDQPVVSFRSAPTAQPHLFAKVAVPNLCAA